MFPLKPFLLCGVFALGLAGCVGSRPSACIQMDRARADARAAEGPRRAALEAKADAMEAECRESERGRLEKMQEYQNDTRKRKEENPPR